MNVTNSREVRLEVITLISCAGLLATTAHAQTNVADPLPPEVKAQYVAAGMFETGLTPAMPEDAECPPITLHFGSRTNKSGQLRGAKDGSFHAGVDWALPVGTPIVAIADGRITRKGSEPDRGPGNYVTVRHWNDLNSSYVHLLEFGPDIAIGRTVTKGQVIGYLGQSGTGASYPHLHLNINGLERKEVEGRTWLYRYDFLQFMSGDMSSIDPVKKRVQQVPVAYMDRAGAIHPPTARVIWPFACDAKAPATAK